MTNADGSKRSLSELFTEVWRQTHPMVVMTVVSVLDYELVRSITKKMPNLDKEINKRLFRGYGPLSTFSSRIDIAYALGLISAEIHQELTKIRNIRNLFAHFSGATKFG